jgi:hypothetical protein
MFMTSRWTTTSACLVAAFVVAGCATPPTAPLQNSVDSRFQLTGTVHETAPTESTLLAGARVTIVGGPADAGRTVVADAGGLFDLGSVSGPVTVEVSHPGHVTRRVFVSSTAMAIGLDPELATIALDAEESICPTTGNVELCRDLYSFPAELVYAAPVHHDGVLRFEHVVVVGLENTPYMRWDIRCGENVVAAGRMPGFRPLAIDVKVTAGCRYDVRVFDYFSGPYVSALVRVRITHPS